MLRRIEGRHSSHGLELLKILQYCEGLASASEYPVEDMVLVVDRVPRFSEAAFAEELGNARVVIDAIDAIRCG
jgi:hypothetical protein